jgi:hypothetical protein
MFIVSIPESFLSGPIAPRATKHYIFFRFSVDRAPPLVANLPVPSFAVDGAPLAERQPLPSIFGTPFSRFKRQSFRKK